MGILGQTIGKCLSCILFSVLQSVTATSSLKVTDGIMSIFRLEDGKTTVVAEHLYLLSEKIQITMNLKFHGLQNILNQRVCIQRKHLLSIS